MFDYSLLHWTTFLSAAVLLNLSPGPDLAYILGATAKGGSRSGFSAMLGIWTGALVHVFMAALGLSAILATSAWAFSFVKWVGAAYLIWLGFNALRSAGGTFLKDTVATDPMLSSIFRKGVLVATLNPKVAVFFLAFLPQFIVVGAGPIWAQLMLHGLLIIVVAAFIEPPLVLAGGKLSGALRDNRRIGAWLDRGLGFILISLGVRLAVSKQ